MQISITTDNKYDVLIKEFDAKEITVDLASGYQKFAVSLAIRIALTNISNTPLLDGLIIDEGFSCMDKENQYLAIEFLNKLSQRYELLFIISHLESLKSSIDRPLSIIKKPGNPYYSYIRNTPLTNEIPIKVLPADANDAINIGKTYCFDCKKYFKNQGYQNHSSSAQHRANIHK